MPGVLSSPVLRASPLRAQPRSPSPLSTGPVRGRGALIAGCVIGLCAVGSADLARAEDAPRAPVTTPAGAVRVVPTAAAAPVSATSVSRAPEPASALAKRLGLAHQDDGASVLLSDGALRVRLYPNTHVMAFDGQDRRLRGVLARSPQGVMLPGPAAVLIEEHVAKARGARAQSEAQAALRKAAAAKPVPVKPTLAGLAPLPPLVKEPEASPTPARAAASAPDAGWEVSAQERPWRWIVLHHSDDVCGNLDKYHRVHLEKGWEHGCGYHFVIGNGSKSADGQIEVSQRWTRQLHGAHAKTPDNQFNERGVGICLVGDFERGSGRPSAGQMRALTRLVQWLMDRYDLPVSAVRGHCHCSATCCPGKNFPWTELRSGLRAPPSLAAASSPSASSPSASSAPVAALPPAQAASASSP